MKNFFDIFHYANSIPKPTSNRLSARKNGIAFFTELYALGKPTVFGRSFGVKLFGDISKKVFKIRRFLRFGTSVMIFDAPSWAMLQERLTSNFFKTPY